MGMFSIDNIKPDLDTYDDCYR